jgi:hypothetical protein
MVFCHCPCSPSAQPSPKNTTIVLSTIQPVQRVEHLADLRVHETDAGEIGASKMQFSSSRL